MMNAFGVAGEYKLASRRGRDGWEEPLDDNAKS
jgi:hypothetical protein